MSEENCVFDVVLPLSSVFGSEGSYTRHESVALYLELSLGLRNITEFGETELGALGRSFTERDAESPSLCVFAAAMLVF
jgi:hypothetical protein